MSKKFLVAVDGSDHGWKAADVASDLAKASDAELLVLHVVRKESFPEDPKLAGRYWYQKELGDEIIREAKERVRENGVDRVTSRVVEGHPAHEIVETAKSENVDMIFVGSRGLGDATGLMMGSVSHKVMHIAPCTCVAVK